MEHAHINLKHFVAVVGHLSFKSAIFAKQCVENPDLGKYEKGVDDPVTDADYKIQTYLIKGIEKFFPKLRIVGEETVEYKGEIDFDYDKIDLENYPQECELDENVPVEELCLWIDPIDNTKAFVKGKMDGVTTLIGMTRNNRPFLGAITSPYAVQQEKTIFKPYLNLGYVPKQRALQTWDNKTWSKLQVPKRNEPFIISTSRRSTHNPVEEVGKMLSTKVDRRGGAGRKVNIVVQGAVDAMIYLQSGNCMWDSCAGDCIIQAMGGIFTDMFGHPLNYDHTVKDYHNLGGNLCTFSAELHKGIVESYATIIGNRQKKQ